MSARWMRFCAGSQTKYWPRQTSGPQAHFDPHGLVYADVSKDGPTPLEGAKQERVAWTTLLLDIQAGVKGGAQ